MNGYRFSKRSYAKLDGPPAVHPDLVRVALVALSLSPYDFGILHGARTQKEQDDLYAQGRTRPGPIVTWTRNSKHLVQKDGFGHAIDIGIYINGKLTWDERYYHEVSAAFIQAAKQLGIKIKWGVMTAKGITDTGHYEIVTS